MLTIGEFSSICRVSTKTLRYYAEIGLILPEEINPENGYRYYSINQLETMLFINRLKAYHFSLEEIKAILESEEAMDDKLYAALSKKKKEISMQMMMYKNMLEQIDADMSAIRKGKSIMSYMEDIGIELVEVPKMYLLSIRKMIQEQDFPDEYGYCFEKLFKKMKEKNLTASAPPMVLFHSDEYSPFGLDTEFAVPINEYATGTRDFYPGLCLKTVVHGSYSQLSSVYAKQIEWAEKEGYENCNALYEVYVTSLSLAGTVSTLPNAKGDLYVQMGMMRSLVNIKDLEITKTAKDVKRENQRNESRNRGRTAINKSASIRPEINVMGMTVDEAIAQLDKYIDDACLANLAQITVVHGKGTGALRKGLHNYFKQLKKQKRISGYRDGEYGEGDLGVTVVIL